MKVKICSKRKENISVQFKSLDEMFLIIVETRLNLLLIRKK